MTREEVPDPRVEAKLPVKHLAAPSASPTNGNRLRSTSLAPSFRSSHSHTTFVEDKDNAPELENRQLQRQQTFKISLDIGWWDLFKAFFNRRALTTKIEDSIEIVQPHSRGEKMYPDKRSPFDIDIYVAPKVNSTEDHKTRCLLDTGCLPGNIVSQELVDSLGYVPEDYEPLCYVEKEGAQTATGERLVFDAAILLSWHHNMSPQKFRKMRFLISSTTTVDMIIGIRSIIRHNLLIPPVFVHTDGTSIVKPLRNTNTKLEEIRGDLAVLRSAVKNYKTEIVKEEAEPQPNEKKIQKLKNRLGEKRHELTLKELEENALVAKKNGKIEEEKRLRNLIQIETDAWIAELAKKAKKKEPDATISQDQAGSSKPRPPQTDSKSDGARASTP